MKKIVIANPKGGTGKSTTTQILAHVFNKHGGNVAIMDCDPNQPHADWKLRTKSNINVFSNITDINFTNQLNNLSNDICLIDCEGTRNRLTTIAITKADLVLIPLKLRQLELDHAVKLVSLILEDNENFNHNIKYRLLITRCDVLMSNEEKFIENEILINELKILKNRLLNRACFSGFWQFGCTIYDYPSNKITGCDKAIIEAENLTNEIMEIL